MPTVVYNGNTTNAILDNNRQSLWYQFYNTESTTISIDFQMCSTSSETSSDDIFLIVNQYIGTSCDNYTLNPTYQGSICINNIFPITINTNTYYWFETYFSESACLAK